MLKIDRETRRAAEAEGLTEVSLVPCPRGSHRWLAGMVDGREVRLIVASTKAGDPRSLARIRGNIRQAIRRAAQGRAFA